MICSTLSGKVAVKHPKLGTLVREDGAVFNKAYANKYNHEHHWTFGSSQGEYRCISIKGRTYAIHRLVAEAFIPNPENKPFVDHINRNPSDNRVANLRWATVKENSENSITVYNRKYQTRACDDPTGYARERRAANPEHYHEINRRHNEKRRASKKQQKAAQ